jgi:hypothetical protein
MLFCLLWCETLCNELEVANGDEDGGCRLHPAMFIMAVAYKTLDSETGRTYEKSLVSKIAKVKDTLSTFLKWWKTS